MGLSKKFTLNANEVLGTLLTVDGPGSGLNADLLDGEHAEDIKGELRGDISVMGSQKVSKSGDTMTGALTLSGIPNNDLHAAPKGYVDEEVKSLRPGFNWEKRYTPQALRKICYGSGTFMALAQGRQSFFSNNGRKWQTGPFGQYYEENEFIQVCYRPNYPGQKAFYALAAGGDNALACAAPTDLVWTYDESGIMDDDEWADITGTSYRGILAAVSRNGKRAYSSAYTEFDMQVEDINQGKESWVKVIGTPDRKYIDPVWGTFGGSFHAFANGSTEINPVERWYIGIANPSYITPPYDFQMHSFNAEKPWNSAAINQLTNTLICLADDGTIGRAALYTGDTNWTTQQVFVSEQLNNIICADGLFIAFGNTGSGNIVVSEDDGITWQLHHIIDDDCIFTDITYGDGLFVLTTDKNYVYLSGVFHYVSGGGSGSGVNVVADLSSNSDTDALAASQGKLLDQKKVNRYEPIQIADTMTPGVILMLGDIEAPETLTTQGGIMLTEDGISLAFAEVLTGKTLQISFNMNDLANCLTITYMDPANEINFTGTIYGDHNPPPGE